MAQIQNYFASHKPHFEALCLAPLAGAVLVLFYFIDWLVRLGQTQASYNATLSESARQGLDRMMADFNSTDFKINATFMIIAFVLFVALFVSILFRKKTSHIGYVLAYCLTLLAYILSKIIYLSVEFTNKSINPLVFYSFSFVLVCLLGYFYVLKALDGDAEFKYFLVFGIALACLFFAAIGQYTFFEAYGHLGDFPFWDNLMATRWMLYFLVTATIVSVKSDYDPNPIQLDEFGNPIDEKKSQVSGKKMSVSASKTN